VERPAALGVSDSDHGQEGLERPEAFVADPLPNVMGGDSSFEDADVVGRVVPSPPQEMEAQEMSQCRSITTEDVSDDKADSESTARL
jgi:hypothetical protein